MILIFATLKHNVKRIFEPTVTIAQMIRLISKLKLIKFLTKIPRIEEKILIIINKKTVFRKSRFASFRLISIEIFMIDEMNDIRKYPMISAYVPKYLGKNIMLAINTADEIT